MEITRLEMKNFRNYRHEVIEFLPKTNIIYGDNAQGKTNILEAVYLAANGRSHRTKNDEQLIRFGADFAEVLLDFHDRHRAYRVQIRILRDRRKIVRMNNVPINRLSVLVNYFNAVIFSPEDLELVKGSPQMRRRFMDSAISALSPRYMSELVSYHKTLMQKNSLLRAMRNGRKDSGDTLGIWNMQLAQSGARIMKERANFIEGISNEAARIHSEIAGCSLLPVYTPSLDKEILTAHNPEDMYLQKIEQHKAREIENGSSLFGIQRDDVRFFIDDNEAKIYASQGQQRTIVLCLKLAQTEYIRAKRDEYPVLLLDDIMSELDEKHREYLAAKIKDKQVLITCTDKSAALSARYIHVHDGSAKPV